MELAVFNADYGFLEGIVRGYRSTFLSQLDYKKMKTADNLDDLRTILEGTDYASAFCDESGPVNTGFIAKRCNEKLAGDFSWVSFARPGVTHLFRYLRQQSDGKLAIFLEFIA